MRKVLLAALAATFAAGVAACDNDDSLEDEVEDVGDELEDAGDDVGDDLEDAGEELEDDLEDPNGR